MDILTIGRIGLGLLVFGFVGGVGFLTYYFHKPDSDGKKYNILQSFGVAIFFMFFWLLMMASASDGVSVFTDRDIKDFKESSIFFKSIIILISLSYVVGLLMFIIYAVKSGKVPVQY